MKIFKYCIITLFFFILATVISAQCIGFARSIAKPKLAPYIHDGNYNATFIEEGESAELYKTFFKGQEYRMVLGVVENLPKNVRIRILDAQKNVIFDNADHNYAYVWDFESKTNETLTIHIKIPESNPENDTFIGGCITVLFGVKSEGKRK